MLDDFKVRDWLKTQLQPILPPSWSVHKYQRMPAVINVTTVVIKHLQMEPLPAAPAGAIEHEIVVLVASNYEDQSKAEDKLDDDVLAFCTALSSVPDVTWTGAKKTMIDPTLPYLGWDITLTMITQTKRD